MDQASLDKLNSNVTELDGVGTEDAFRGLTCRISSVVDFTPVATKDDYRKNAADTVEMANRASTLADKGRLLAMAANWLDLADRVASQPDGRTLRMHPMISSKLRDRRLDCD